MESPMFFSGNSFSSKNRNNLNRSDLVQSVSMLFHWMLLLSVLFHRELLTGSPCWEKTVNILQLDSLSDQTVRLATAIGISQICFTSESEMFWPDLPRYRRTRFGGEQLFGLILVDFTIWVLNNPTKRDSGDSWRDGCRLCFFFFFFVSIFINFMNTLDPARHGLVSLSTLLWHSICLYDP